MLEDDWDWCDSEDTCESEVWFGMLEVTTICGRGTLLTRGKVLEADVIPAFFAALKRNISHHPSLGITLCKIWTTLATSTSERLDMRPERKERICQRCHSVLKTCLNRPRIGSARAIAFLSENISMNNWLLFDMTSSARTRKEESAACALWQRKQQKSWSTSVRHRNSCNAKIYNIL